MKKPNTKQHWTALAVARYYDEHGTACRVRDLYPFVKQIHDDPQYLSTTLYKLRADGIIDYIAVEIEGEGTSAYAFYPTRITIEDLRDIGEPTMLPDDEPLPDGVDTSIPTDAYVAAEDEVALPADEQSAPEYGYFRKEARPHEPVQTRGYDTSRFEADAEATPGPGQTPDGPDDPTDDPSDTTDATGTTCEYCGEGFETENSRKAHQPGCTENPNVTGDSCRYCGEYFDTPRGISLHENHCLDEIHAAALDERDVAEDPLDDLDTVDVGSEPIDPPSGGEPLGDIETPDQPVAGSYATTTDWSRIATRLERKASDADDHGLTEVAAAYSQFAVLAVEGDLDLRTAHILLGTPVLDLESRATAGVF